MSCMGSGTKEAYCNPGHPIFRVPPPFSIIPGLTPKHDPSPSLIPLADPELSTPAPPILNPLPPHLSPPGPSIPSSPGSVGPRAGGQGVQTKGGDRLRVVWRTICSGCTQSHPRVCRWRLGGRDMDTRRSTTGYVFKVYGSVVAWRSKRLSICGAVNDAG